MHVVMRRADDLPGDEIIHISTLCASNEVEALYRRDSEVETPRRFIHLGMPSGLPAFFVKHTSFVAGPTPTGVYVTHVARLGLVNLFTLGLEQNQNSILYWIVAPIMPVMRHAESGLLVCSRPIGEETPIQILSNSDGIVVAADVHNYSTVVAVETLKFQAT